MKNHFSSSSSSFRRRAKRDIGAAPSPYNFWQKLSVIISCLTPLAVVLATFVINHSMKMADDQRNQLSIMTQLISHLVSDKPAEKNLGISISKSLLGEDLANKILVGLDNSGLDESSKKIINGSMVKLVEDMISSSNDNVRKSAFNALSDSPFPPVEIAKTVAETLINSHSNANGVYNGILYLQAQDKDTLNKVGVNLGNALEIGKINGEKTKNIVKKIEEK